MVMPECSALVCESLKHTSKFRWINAGDMGWRRDDRDAHGLLYLHIEVQGRRRMRKESTKQEQRRRRESRKTQGKV